MLYSGDSTVSSRDQHTPFRCPFRQFGFHRVTESEIKADHVAQDENDT